MRAIATAAYVPEATASSLKLKLKPKLNVSQLMEGSIYESRFFHQLNKAEN